MMDWVTGEKFKALGKFTYAPVVSVRDDYDRLQNTLNLHKVLNGDIIYTHTMYVKGLFEILDLISGWVIVITHNSDENVDESFEVPKSVKKWYSQNVNVINPKIESIPIGLENDRWFKNIRKKDKMIEMTKQPKFFKNLVYMNHNIDTYPEERQSPYQLFENKPWVTTEKGKNGFGFDKYLSNVYNHRYVICPRGNGIDTHRLWETLYMGSVPIVKKDINNWFYNDMPILYVNDWEEVTEDLLNDMWSLYEKPKWNWKKLTFKYWKDKIEKA